MNKTEQRIAIAEACGWKSHKHHPCGILSETGVYLIWTNPKKGWPDTTQLPDYLNDLNAIHEAVQSVLWDDVLCKGYCNRLWDVVCPQFSQMSGLNAAVALWLVQATAAQRAEAFLRTLDLWTS